MSTRADFALAGEAPQHYGSGAALGYVWDVATLSWVKETQPGGSGGGGDGAILDGVSATIKATVKDYTNSNPLTTILVDTNGDPVSVGGGTQYAEDTPATAAEIVTMAGVVRTDTPASLVGADGDRTELIVGATGKLWVDAGTVPVTGTFFQATQPVSAAALPLPAGAATSALQTQPGVDIGDVTVNNGAAGAAVNIQDGGNSITVDGTFFQATQPVSAAALPLPAGAATSALQTQPGVDIGDVTVNNAAGAAAVNVQDGGNSLTVDGTVTTTPPANASTNVTQWAGTAVDVNSGVKSAGTLRVVLATDQPALTNKLLVTPDSVALPANQSVNVAQVAGTNTVTGGVAGIIAVGGNVANAVAATANPVPVGGIFTTTPATLTTGQTATMQFTAAQNLKQDLTTVGGTAVSTGTGAGGAGIPRVTVSNDSALATVTTVTAVTAITNALPTGANIIGSVNGDVDHDVTNTLKQIQVAGNANPVDVPPTLVSANGDRVRGWFDRAGSQVMRRRKLRESYTAVCRIAEAAARLDATFTFVANTNKQLVTLHHAATATKELRIQKVVIVPTLLGTAAGVTIFELRYITGTPATGNPAITPQKHQQAAAATEAVVLVLPTTGGTDGAPNSPLGSFIIDHGIEGAASVLNPMPVSPQITLYDSSSEDDEMLPVTLRVGTLEGVCITGRSTAAVVLRFFAIIKYTEEIP